MKSEQQLSSLSWRRAWLGAGACCLAAFGATAAATAEAQPPARVIAPLLSGDEAVVVTEHRIQTTRGPLTYEARAGRIPIRNEETGEVRGHLFFVAYVVKTSGPPRPIAFAWNGGPTVAAWTIHTQGLGPRLRDGDTDRFVDNPETLLLDSDLVFMDPLETGFSRPANPEFAPEFLQFQGDVAATSEFIRAYTARFRTADQPLFVIGQSYGVFRGSAVVEDLGKRGQKVAGAVMFSGDIPNIPQDVSFYDAMHIPARTATAFHYNRLSPELMRDREATLAEVLNWARTVYQPALDRIDQLTDAEREQIAVDLARYTGLRPDQIDRRTLVVYVDRYANIFFDDPGKKLGLHDTRVTGPGVPDNPRALDRYLRDELQYASDLTYRGVERGYMPTPGPVARTSNQQFYYNQPGFTSEIWDKLKATGEVTELARANPPWLINALRADPDLDVFIATGRFDPLNMCQGNVIATATLPENLSSRITNHCYDSGHVIYRDASAKADLLRDLSQFVRETAAGSARR